MWEFLKIDLIHILLTAVGMVSLPFNHVYSMQQKKKKQTLIIVS